MIAFQSLLVVTVLSSVASGLAIYLTVKLRTANALPGCRQGSGCAAIAATRWSRWMTLPVSAFAAAVYFALAVTSLNGTFQFSIVNSHAITFLALAAGTSAVWFIFLQILVVRRACFYCNTIHSIGIICCVCILTNPSLMPNVFDVACVSAVILCLICGQSFGPHKTYALVRPPECLKTVEADEAPTATFGSRETVEEAERQAVLPAARPWVAPVSTRDVVLRSGKLRLTVGSWPILGSCDAADVIALAFDYTCPTCRVLHGLVKQIIHDSAGKLAVLMLPVPQHPNCNHTVTKACPAYRHSCQYTQIALSLWLSHPERYDEFDEFLFTGADVPPLGLAMRHAEGLVGHPVDHRGDDERVNAIVARAINVFEGLKVKQIPNLLLPDAELPGLIESVDKLKDILATELRRIFPVPK